MSKQLDWPYVINLGNSILGVSILAMPFCFRQCGVLLGVLLLLASAWLTGVACELLMKSAVTSKKRSYEYLALHTFGPLGKLAVEVSIIGMLLGTCVAFHVIIGDLGPAIISKILGLENTPQLRTSVMVILGLFVGLPLGLLKNIESLSNVSAISIGFYMVFVAEVFASAFPNLWSGIWVAKVEVWNPEGVFKCLPIFSLAYGCQTQLFVMYDALSEPSIKRMNSISKNAISLCTGVYLLVGFFGYMAFCDEAISGDILVNFRPTIFSEAVKLGFVMSVAVSFPLVIFPCRTSIHTLLFAKHAGTHENFGGSPVVPEPHFKLITIAIVLSTLIVGIYLPNIEFILAITGATMGSMICYIFPAVLFITLMSMSKNSSKSTAQLVLFLGVTILLASTYTTLYAQDQRVPDTIESVVKVAEPQPMKPIGKDVNENNMGAGDAPNVQPNDNIKKDGDDVIKDKNKDKTDGNQVEEKKPAEIQKDDRRQEPPNPHAPVDDTLQSKEELKEEMKVEDKNDGQNEDKKTEDERREKSPQNQGVDEKKDSGVENKPKQDVIPVKRKVNATGEKTEKELKEAKVLLEELKEQRDEQKKLLDAQRELINELKQHQKEAHPNIQNQKPVGDENVEFQRAGDVAPRGDGTVLAANVKKQVEEEVAKVVKNAVDAQQEEQLHNIAKQNHQEMLESLDGQKQQLNQLPAEVNNGGMAQPNIQAQQQPGLDAGPVIKQGGNVNLMQQQAGNIPQNQQQAGNIPQNQQVIGQQSQDAPGNIPPVVGKQPQMVGQQSQRQAGQQVQTDQNPQVQGAANNFPDGKNKQPVDTLDTLKLGQQNPDPQIQANNNPVQGQPPQRMQDAGLKQQQPAVQQNVQNNVILPNVQNLNKPDIGKQSINSPMRNKR